MLTIHAADQVRTADGPAAGGAVLVDGDRITAVGPVDELAGAHPRARVRRWPGVLVPGLVHTGPLPAAPTPRERVHALLRAGRTAVLASCVASDEELRSAVARAGLTVLPAPGPRTLAAGARADFAVLDAGDACVATVLAGRLVHRRA
ncbi:hypothetical protein GCM10027168_59830 [Streptomyces capparidis]